MEYEVLWKMKLVMGHEQLILCFVALKFGFQHRQALVCRI